MKRLFVSLLVLAMTSTVSAGPQIMVDGYFPGGMTFFSQPSLNITLGIYTDALIQGGEGYSLALVVDASYGTIDYTSGFVVPPYDTDPGFYLEHSVSAVNMGVPLPAGEDGIFSIVSPMNILSIDPYATIFNGIEFLNSSYHNEVRINLYVTDLDTSYLADTVLVITPEPMTIGLLALGAMFLRRRK